MTALHRTKSTLVAGLLMGVFATASHADLSPADIDRIDGQSGIPVVASDGTPLGTTNGVTIKGERARLFLVTQTGTLFNRLAFNVNIITRTDKLTLQNGSIVVDADRTQLRLMGRKSVSEDGPVEITLLGR